MNKTNIVIVVLLLAAGIAAGFYFGQRAPSGGNIPQELPRAQNNDVVVETPRIGQVVTSPLKVEGKARGNWYFEASFPVRLETVNGKILFQSFIMTDGDWMTTDFVPFKKEFTFAVPTDEDEGVLVLEKDNPSGLPQNSAELKVRVRFR